VVLDTVKVSRRPLTQLLHLKRLQHTDAQLPKTPISPTPFKVIKMFFGIHTFITKPGSPKDEPGDLMQLLVL
jgi:hypothetical protein